MVTRFFFRIIIFCTYFVFVRLYELGYQVVGLEGFETPILEFFDENGLKYEKETQDNVVCYSVKYIRI